MSARPENEFPTIRDVRDRLTELVDQGLGDHPAQVLIVPDSTMQAIAIVTGGLGYDRTKPALLIELTGTEQSARLPVTLVSTDRMTGHGMSGTRQ